MQMYHLWIHPIYYYSHYSTILNHQYNSQQDAWARKKKYKKNRLVQSNRKKGRRSRLAMKAPEAPEAPEAEASVPLELLPEPSEVLPDAPPEDVEAQPQELQQEKDN